MRRDVAAKEKMKNDKGIVKTEGRGEWYEEEGRGMNEKRMRNEMEERGVGWEERGTRRRWLGRERNERGSCKRRDG
jgi:hypothetical protein